MASATTPAVERRREAMLLKPLHVGQAPGSPRAVQHVCPQADRIDTPLHWSRMASRRCRRPSERQVVHIPESLTAMEAQVAQEDTTRLRPTAANTLGHDLEAVQMLVAPVKHPSGDVVKMCQMVSLRTRRRAR